MTPSQDCYENNMKHFITWKILQISIYTKEIVQF